MDIAFNSLDNHFISMSDFTLKWRFIDKKNDILPDIHLSQLKPLDKHAAKFLSDFLSKTDLHADFPFKKDFFRTIDKIEITADNFTEIKKWLYHRALPFDKKVYLSWDNENAMIVPWKILIKYFDNFYMPSADDLTIFDESLQWSVLFFHEDEIYFGTNTDYKLTDNFADVDFLL